MREKTKRRRAVKNNHYNWNYDYSQTLWMKMFLARPDFRNNRSEVLITFEQALDIIKTVDALTQGITKIIYLVGWQGLGHDDCFPEMEVVNDYLKRECDKDGRESLCWLFNEAKKYNTVVSFHGNLADAYSQNPSHEEFVKANALCNGIDGKPAVIERFNDRDAFKTSYKQYWESGLFKKYWDRFCEAVPVIEAGTVHLDNYCVAQSLNPYTTAQEDIEARNKMLDYIASLGIDVTTEYTYREAELRAESHKHPIHYLYRTTGKPIPEVDWRSVPMHTLGRIPASWWTNNITAAECVNIPPALYSGHLTDSALLAVFYGAMHGEDIWMEHGVKTENWADEFLYQFCTLQLPYFYLNRYDRVNIVPDGEDYIAYFSDDIVSYGKTGTIVKNGVMLKEGNDVCLPLDKECETFIAYSENGRSGEWFMPDARFEKAKIYEITTDSNKYIGEADIRGGKISLTLAPSQAFVIKAE